MKLLSLIFLILSAPWTSTGNIFPASGTNNAGIGATAWTNPGNIVSDNNSTASCNAGASSQYLVASNFTFELPSGAVVLGITARAGGTESSGGTESVNMQLQDESGALFGSSKSVTWNGTSETVYTYGGASDLWGATITEAIVEDADFGVRLWFTTAHNITVDYITLAVEYSVGTTNFFQFFTHKISKTNETD